MTQDELDAIRARAEAATPGPWKGLEYFWGINGSDKNLVVRDMGAGRHAKENQANQDFIAHAREDIPALLAEIDLLTRANDALGESRNILMANEAVYEKECQRLEAEIVGLKNVIAMMREFSFPDIWKKCVDAPEFSFDDFGMENLPPTCATCGSSLQAVRPGKWQCPKCE